MRLWIEYWNRGNILTKKEKEQKVISTEILNRYEEGIYSKLDRYFDRLHTLDEVLDALRIQCKIRDRDSQKEEIEYLYSEDCISRWPLDDSQSMEDFIEQKIRESFQIIVSKNQNVGEDEEQIFVNRLLRLKNIDENYYNYYAFMLALLSENDISVSAKKYSVEKSIAVNLRDIELVLGKTRMEELHIYQPYIRESVVDQLTKEEKERLYNLCIARENFIGRPELHIRTGKKEAMMVEIDMEQSREELKEYIVYLKDEYEKKKILNLFEWLNPDIERKETVNKVFLKSIVDMLYIYDCKQLGYFNNTIVNELYERPIKGRNISKYYDYIADIIENKKYTLKASWKYAECGNGQFEKDFLDDTILI